MSSAPRFLALAAVLVLAGTAATSAELRTNRTKSLVPLEELVSGGPAPDGIPAIDRPAFVTPAAASVWLRPREPVLAVRIGDDTRAYPLQILVWREIVNDVIGGVPVAVTYCPLCNSALVFERVVDGLTLDFGTSGLLYKSDLVMYDRRTHSLWSQLDGRALVGDLAGARLTARPANTIAFEAWRAAHPAGKVLARDTGHRRSYGVNPYQAYDQPAVAPIFFDGRLDPRRPPKERVVGIAIGQARRAYPWPLLEQHRAVHDTVGGEGLVVFYQPGTLSALDATEIARSRAVGATAVYSSRLGDRTLTFDAAPDGFRDRQTGSQWSLFGVAVAGPLAGRRLTPIPHVDAFWFAWAAFNPSTTIWERE